MATIEVDDEEPEAVQEEVVREESPRADSKSGLSKTALDAIRQYSMLQRFRQERKQLIDY